MPDQTIDNNKNQEKAKEIESIDWIKVPETVIEDLDLLPHQITDIQLYILSGLYNEGAVTTRGVWKRALLKKFQMEVRASNVIEEEKSKENIFNKVKDIISNSNEEEKIKEYLSYSEVVSNVKDRGMMESDFMDVIETSYQITNSSKPAYETVLNNLESLESQNLVRRKPGTNVNAKYLWMMNPKLLKHYRKRREEVKERLDLEPRTLNFYNIVDPENLS